MGVHTSMECRRQQVYEVWFGHIAFWRGALFVFLSKHYPPPCLALRGKKKTTVCMDINNFLPATLFPLSSSRDTVPFKPKTWGARSGNIFLLGRINTNSIQLLVPRGCYREYWARICKRLRSLGLNSKESIQPAHVAWRAGTKTLFLLGA